MNTNPTRREFWRRSGDIVQTADGRYFKVENDSAMRGWFAVGWIFINAAVVILIFLSSHIRIPDNCFFDQAVLVILIWWGLMRLQYRMARFREITDGWEGCISLDRIHEKQRELSPAVRRIGWVLLAAVLLFSAANSFTAFYVRSHLDNKAQIIKMELNGNNEVLLWKDGDGDEVDWPADVTPWLVVETAFTLDKASFSLDGEPYGRVNAYRETNISLFWRYDYFVKGYEIPIFDVHDGSVLELTCGDMHRTIIFHIKDKQGT